VSLIGKIYRRNIYGVMGTLVFHILIVLAFILADVNMKGTVKEEELLIEFPDILPEIEEKEIEEETSDEREDLGQENLNNRTNVASNRLATQNITTSADDFFDDDYLKEVEAAKQLVSDVNNQISKKIIDIEDIEMPAETTDGMNPDSIKNVIYVGESNIVYYLENRYHLSLQNPLYLAHGGGQVVVKIVVNQQGRVIDAVPVKNSNVKDEQIYIYAKAAALRTVFNIDLTAPASQEGTIHYTFIAQ
jgi:hypothetical protein